MFTTGLTVVSTKVNGKITRWKDTACLNGLMVEGIRENTSTIKKRAWAHSIGKESQLFNFELCDRPDGRKYDG